MRILSAKNRQGVFNFFMPRLMLRNIITKEYAELLAEDRLRWSSVAVYLLFAVALFTGYRYYAQTHRQHQQAQDASYRQWLNQGAKNPHTAAHYGFYAYKPVPLLSIIDKGMDDYLGNAVWLEAHKQNDVRHRAAVDSPDLSRFGGLTVGFIWQYILPLIIILLTFNSVSKERESGTLRMLLSTRASGHQLVLGKTLAVAKAVFLVMFLPTFLLSAAIMGLAGGSDAFVSNLPNLGFMAVFYLLFLTVFIVLGVTVSMQARQSGLALIILLGIWTFGAFFVPRMSGGFARSLYRTPSAFAFTEQVAFEKANGVDGHNPADKLNKELEAQTLKKYGVDSLSQLPVSFAAISLQAGENKDWKIFDEHYGSLFQTFRAQDRLMNAFDVLSPSVTMRNLSRALSGTDLDKHIDFANHAEQSRRAMQQTINDHFRDHGAGKDYEYKADQALWKEIPPFRYTMPAVGTVLKNQTLNILILLSWLAGLSLFMWMKSTNLKP